MDEQKRNLKLGPSSGLAASTSACVSRGDAETERIASAKAANELKRESMLPKVNLSAGEFKRNDGPMDLEAIPTALVQVYGKS